MVTRPDNLKRSMQAVASDPQRPACARDAWNRQVAMARGGSTTTSRFDGRNYRISSGIGTMSHVYYNENWQVLEETLGTTKTQYTWDVRYIDAPVLRWRTANGTTTVAYYLNDANMNVTGLVGTTGAFIERYSYDTYGNPAIYASNWSPVQASMLQTNGNVFFYCGYRLDDGIRYADDYQIVSCTYHIRNREYSTKFMWEQRDQGWDRSDLYRYVNCNSIRFVDPFGLNTTTVIPGQQPIGIPFPDYIPEPQVPDELGGEPSTWSSLEQSHVATQAAQSVEANILWWMFFGLKAHEEIGDDYLAKNNVVKYANKWFMTHFRGRPDGF